MKKYDKSTFLQISGGFDTRVQFHAKDYSERRALMQLNKDIFWSQSLQKYLTNETFFFHAKANLMQIPKMQEKCRKNVMGVQIVYLNW